MPHPSPAIVAQDAVRRLPRWTLVLVCLAYVLPGFLGRAPWKNDDIASFGYMLVLQHSPWSQWLHPSLNGIPSDTGSLLPYWLGGLALKWAPLGLAPDLVVRLPFMLLLALTLLATWHATHCLALHRGAQPVAFAFGGEPEPQAYARTLADASLLALLASLGLAQLSHETTPALTQLACTALLYFGLAAHRYKPLAAWLAIVFALPGLALSGAPSTALVWAGVAFFGFYVAPPDELTPRQRRRGLVLLCLLGLGTAALVFALNLPRWQLRLPLHAAEWRSLARLFLWFLWPVWPLVLWTLWQWRRQLLAARQHRHMGLPVMMAVLPVLTTLFTPAGDRALLISLPALATLAAFALPTFRRSVASLIDWFTVLFFTLCAAVIWVVWLSLHTGFPAKPAANIARLAPSFEPVLHVPALMAAVLATLAWVALARWRTGRHRTALWKSLVLPAGGTTLCWLLLMTLWLPALNYGRSFAPQMAALGRVLGHPTCVETFGLSLPQWVGVQFHGGWPMRAQSSADQSCPWLLVQVHARATFEASPKQQDWMFVQAVRRPKDDNDTLLVYRRKQPVP